MFTLSTSRREEFSKINLTFVPSHPGVYIIYDLFGPVYVGRSRVDIQRRLQAHFSGKGSRNIASAMQAGAGPSLTFTYCCLPASEQEDAERILIAQLGVAKFANMRREGLYEEDL